jgi:AcrR family transcriptional regulator
MVLPDERPNTVERRQYFLDTAKRVFASSGFQSTTMEDIAREAGFTKPILYQHFTSKGTLYHEIVAATGATLINRMMEAVSAKVLPREKILAAFHVYFDMVVHDSDAFRILFMHEHDGETAAELREVEMNFVSFIVPYIDSGMDYEQRRLLAAGIVGMAEGSAIYWLIQQEHLGWPTPPEGEAETMAAHCATLAWGGLRALLRD